jgi:DNA-binding transcriptional MerR regulator
MAELSRRSGVARDTIHFYLREGLLPRPRKGGRTIAYYDERHLERLLLIRRLRDEKFLPLAVIRRLLERAEPSLRDEGVGPTERDVEVLAGVLGLVPDPDEAPVVPSAAAREAAATHGIVGRADDPADDRILSLVDEALALEGHARELTLRELGLVAAGQDKLVRDETALFLEHVLGAGELDGPLAALRAGRGVVARFHSAYRDRMLGRVVDELLLASRLAPATVRSVASLPLSDRALERAAGALPSEPEGRALGFLALGRPAPARWLEREGAKAQAESGERTFVSLARAMARLDVTRDDEAFEALERAVTAEPSALGRVLVGEARLVRVSFGRASRAFVDECVAALHLVVATPLDDEPALARCVSWFLRGRTELALPALLGRRASGEVALREALGLAGGLPEPIVAWIVGNASLLLARSGSPELGVAHLARARAVDPEGLLGAATPDGGWLQGRSPSEAAARKLG